MKKIVVINGHPNENSLSTAFADKYYQSAKEAGHNCEVLHLYKIQFDLVLKEDRGKGDNLEHEIIEAQQKIKQADHLVFVFPIWWGTYPALLKGFIDRTFLSGFAFKHRGNPKSWDKLLKGKSARIVTTMDTPKWYYSLVYKNVGLRAMKQGLLEYCGVSPVKTTVFTPVYSSTPEQRENWLSQVEVLGRQSI